MNRKRGIAVLALIIVNNIFAAEVLPAFDLEATVTTREFEANSGKIRRESCAAIIFACSNSGWEVQAVYTNADTGDLVIENCKSIPGGVRRFVIFPGHTNSGMTVATACPVAFPSPGHNEIFVPWLAFCPAPKLPLLDAHRIHRFIGVPVCEANILMHPQNVGFYALKSLASSPNLVGTLLITNTGTRVDLGLANGMIVPEVSTQAPPYDQGYLGFAYEVSAVTNCEHWSFPQRAALKYFNPPWKTGKGKLPPMTSVCELVVRKIRCAGSGRVDSFLTPRVLYALDDRFTQLRAEESSGHWVTNDVWKTIPDSQASPPPSNKPSQISNEIQRRER